MGTDLKFSFGALDIPLYTRWEAAMGAGHEGSASWRICTIMLVSGSFLVGKNLNRYTNQKLYPFFRTLQHYSTSTRFVRRWICTNSWPVVLIQVSHSHYTVSTLWSAGLLLKIAVAEKIGLNMCCHCQRCFMFVSSAGPFKSIGDCTLNWAKSRRVGVLIWLGYSCKTMVSYLAFYNEPMQRIEAGGTTKCRSYLLAVSKIWLKNSSFVYTEYIIPPNNNQPCSQESIQ